MTSPLAEAREGPRNQIQPSKLHLAGSAHACKGWNLPGEGHHGDVEGDFVVRDELHEKGAFGLWELFQITQVSRLG
ncbi:hypothetical protein FRC15_000977 [Serendipita sp. 397]|nr:hypothetical protein FRC15_000977 [Serendipita sp. 397]